MRSVLGALALAAGAGWITPPALHAQTQTGLTEKQARAAVVPYVRAATDCIAKQMGEDPRFATFVREARTMDLLPEAINRCRPAVRTMIEMHDRYYGPGYGEQFARGPYLDDLPRAAGARLKEQISAIIARDAADAEARINRIAATRERKEATTKELWSCIGEKTIALVSSGERAELVADAALALCSSELGRYLDASIAWEGLQGTAPASLVALRDELAAAARKQAVTLAVVAKSRGAPPASPSQSSLGSSSKEASAVRGCIDEMARTARSKLAEQDAKLAAILDLCRPEIEAAARASFTGSNETLDELRQRAFVDAKAMAERALGR
ncbi:hypothetical protein AZC_3707 [Azorhizobium caulinodans ORS 571]|uniref:DUF3829 domain-containing protein n=1 Tax=Azorhizobium caulinodans (strain ATCC 43989 / DSM 5975 / JCM 20966 / LMG 6465 / NBRC 14845 / NCIMB 13405 / ORS 571) TaxID=438753 RepID=A8IN58_AZOC5|nr:hypothetical protein [Azorhizobium caulinodans]BAF89705.1 hypothetical protein AZC_3707 [Azorhizobium caulinodans ORS 571]